MIDRAKNICYVIRVPYVDSDGRLQFQKFLSLHGSQTKQFEAFRDKYFREELQLNPRCIGEWEKDGTTMAYQQTISWKSWKFVEGAPEQVMRGITEREKCW